MAKAKTSLRSRERRAAISARINSERSSAFNDGKNQATIEQLRDENTYLRSLINELLKKEEKQ